MHSTTNFMVVRMTKKHLKDWVEGRGWLRWLSWETHKLFIWENWTPNVCIKMHCWSVDLLIFFFVIPSWKTFLVPTFSFFVRDIWDLPNPESGGDRSWDLRGCFGLTKRWVPARSLTYVSLVCSSFQHMVVTKEINVHFATTRFKMKLWRMSWHVPRSWDDWRSKTPFCYRWSPPKIQPRCTTSCKQLLADIHMRGHSFSPTWTCHTSRPTTMWVWSFPCSMLLGKWKHVGLEAPWK